MNHYHGSPVTDIVESQSHSQSQSLFDNDQWSKPREPVTDHMICDHTKCSQQE